MTTAFLGKGFQLQVEDSPGAGSYTTFPNVKGTFGGPKFSGEDIDITSMDTEGSDREFMAGLNTPEGIPFEMFFDPRIALHRQMFADCRANPKVERNYRMRFAQMTPVFNFTCAAQIQSIGLDVPVDQPIAVTGTLRPRGTIVGPTQE